MPKMNWLLSIQIRIFFFEDTTPVLPEVRDHLVFRLLQAEATCRMHLLLKLAEFSLPGFTSYFSQAALHSLRNAVNF